MNSERIPKAVLDAVTRRACRRVAAVIVRAMADHDVSFDELDRRLGRHRSRRWLELLIDGRGVSLDRIGSMVFAITGGELEITLVRREIEPSISAPMFTAEPQT